MKSFFGCVFNMGWNEGLRVGVYNKVEVQNVKMVN